MSIESFVSSVPYLTTTLAGIFFVFGTLVASFIGLIAARLSTGAPLSRGRSTCDACGQTLSPLALVPIVSWLIARGRCLSCKARITPESTIAEAILGGTFVLAYFKIGLTLSLPILLVALTLLLGLVLYDRAHHILPPVLLWPFVGFSAVFGALEASTIEALGMTALIALVFALFLALIHVASGGRAMGLADAPLVFGLSMLSGTMAFSGLMYSFWIGGVIGIALLALRAGGTTIKSEVPFAPFLAAGFLLAYFSSWDVLLLADLLTPVI